MQAIANSIRGIFPITHEKIVWFTDRHTVIETGKNATFTELIWTNARFLVINADLAKGLKGFFERNKSVRLFHDDCDSLMLFEYGSERFFYASEMKSSFNTTEIAHAKEQLISSILKINMLLNLTQYWQIEKTKVKAFIIAPAPTDSELIDEWIRDWQKKEHGNPRVKSNPVTIFCGKLLWHWRKGKPLLITPTNSFHLGPCKIGERGFPSCMELRFIDLPAGSSTITLDALSFI